MKKKLFAIFCLTLALLALSACGLRQASNALVAPTPAATIVPTPMPTIAPTPVPTIAPTPVPTPIPTPVPTPAPTPVPTPVPTPAPTPVPASLPVITKNPTDETVKVNGKCQFVTRYENAKWAEWHFVSPDGSRDIDYALAEKEFPTMKILNGYTKDLTLDSIPAAANGWRVYCRFSNDAGSVKSGSALITVVSDQPVAPTPVTPGEAQALGRTMTVYRLDGSQVYVAEYSDGTWKTADGVVYYLGADGVLRGRGVEDLYTVNPAAAAPKNYSGVYYESVAGRATIEVSTNPSFVNISCFWPNGYSERYEWYITGNIDANGIMDYTDAVRYILRFDESGNQVSSEVLQGCSGRMVFTDNGVYWTDYIAGSSANNTYFAKS